MNILWSAALHCMGVVWPNSISLKKSDHHSVLCIVGHHSVVHSASSQCAVNISLCSQCVVNISPSSTKCDVLHCALLVSLCSLHFAPLCNALHSVQCGGGGDQCSEGQCNKRAVIRVVHPPPPSTVFRNNNLELKTIPKLRAVRLTQSFVKSSHD